MAQLLGSQIRLARRTRRWTVEELGERIGASHATVRKVEQGDPSVRLGTALEAAVILGIPLFHADRSRLDDESELVEARLALLPQVVRKPAVIDDDF